MTHAGGIDLGGTKIEARLFTDALGDVDRKRIPTPADTYAEMLDALVSQLRWLDAAASGCPIGVGAPGLINPDTGMMFTANLPATGHRLAADLSNALGRPVPVINDCRAFALSEATRGAAKDHTSVLGLVIGTGVAGGHVINGKVLGDLNGQHGEYGHLPLPAATVARHNLPLITCGCGSVGCFETYLAGPGLARLGQLKTGRDLTPETISTDPELSGIMDIWLDIATDLLLILTRTVDPQCIVLGGGLGMQNDLPERLQTSLAPKRLPNTQAPLILQAEGGDASGARGAAIFALAQESAHV